MPASLKAVANYPKFEEIYNIKFAQAQETEEARFTKEESTFFYTPTG